jgi:hypothetical protein
VCSATLVPSWLTIHFIYFVAKTNECPCQSSSSLLSLTSCDAKSLYLRHHISIKWLTIDDSLLIQNKQYLLEMWHVTEEMILGRVSIVPTKEIRKIEDWLDGSWCDNL